MKQQTFFDYLNHQGLNAREHSTKTLKTHGGASPKGRRKVARPYHPKKWHHLILKSHRAKGTWSFLSMQHKSFIENVIEEKAKKFGVRVDQLVNVGNHLHLKIKCSNKGNFQKFLKSITCLIARTITGARRGRKAGRFWQGLAFTRILSSYFEERQLNGYFQGNEIEALFGKEARELFLTQFNQWIYRQRLVAPQR